MGNYRDRSKWRFDGTIRAAFLREFVGTPLLGGSIDGNPTLAFMASNATITPAITLSGDGPCQWEVTEVDGTKYYYNANSFSHTRTAVGNMTVRLLNTTQVAPYVTSIDFSGDGIVSSIDSLNLNIFTNLTTSLFLYNNPSLSGNASSIPLPAGLLAVNLINTGLIGSMIGYYPTVMTHFYMYNNKFTGFPLVPNSTNLRDVRVYDQGPTNMTQARIDAFVVDVYSKRAGFTYVTPFFNIGGTNADPSGIYQNPFPNPPASPLEMIYVLVNDPFTEGFNKQIWTY